MRKNGVLTYLHGDHLGSTVLTSNSSGAFTGQDLRHAYGRYRAGTELGTENRFTGQKLDGAGLMYFNARYYDPELGQFLSPDTIVPDPGNLFDYNRYMYVRGNPMKHTDPTGHCIFGLDTAICVAVAVAALVGGTANAVGSAGGQVYQNWDSERSVSDNFTDVNGTKVGIAFGFGALAGGAAPLTGGATALAVSGVLGAGQEVTTDMVADGKSFSEAVDTGTAIAAGLGVAGTMWQGAMPSQLMYTASNGDELLIATGKEALAYGGEKFMQNTNSQLLQEQLSYIGGAKFVTGFGISNLPVSAPSSQDECSWTCPIQTVTNWWNGEEKK